MLAFARFSKLQQWVLAVLMALLCIGILGMCYVLPLQNWRWLPLCFLVIPFIAPLESLLLTPLYALTGRFRYYSPMLLVTTSQKGVLDLHAGALFDYLMHLRWRDRGRRATRVVTVELLHGLLAITDEVAQGALPPDTRLVASSYFFSNRSLERLGFQLCPPASGVVQNLLMASLSIALRLSFTRGRLSFPKLRHIRQAATTAGVLAQHRNELEQLLLRLQPAGAPAH